MDLLCALAVNFKGGDFHLLIIDSIINAYRADYVGRGELADRQQHLNQFLHKCAEYAEGLSPYSPLLSKPRPLSHL